jgi:hypothetical protein
MQQYTALRMLNTVPRSTQVCMHPLDTPKLPNYQTITFVLSISNKSNPILINNIQYSIYKRSRKTAFQLLVQTTKTGQPCGLWPVACGLWTLKLLMQSRMAIHIRTDGACYRLTDTPYAHTDKQHRNQETDNGDGWRMDTNCCLARRSLDAL